MFKRFKNLAVMKYFIISRTRNSNLTKFGAVFFSVGFSTLFDVIEGRNCKFL